jgi:membrane-associated phospholipid phosphatase
MKTLLIVLSVTFLSYATINAQDTLSVSHGIDSSRVIQDTKDQFAYKKLIVPAVFISYGVAGLSVKSLKQLNESTRFEISEHRPDHIRLDNYTQFAPAAFVYGLNAFGIRGKHNLRDRSIIYGTSLLITSAITFPVKHLVKEERPDQSDPLSFPSGHTAAAFASAQFMFREYRDTNFLLSISGYSFAVFTGIYRMLNNKHWLGDVVAGAGVGILSTELSYWLYPKISSLLSGKNKTGQMMIMPYCQKGNAGIGFIKNF